MLPVSFSVAEAYRTGPPRLTGRKWADLVLVSSISAAGYVPQIFSPMFTPDMIRTLLDRSGAKALTYDAEEYPDIPSETTIPTLPCPTADELERISAQLRQARGGPAVLSETDLCPVTERQSAVIFHSSGTTSGIPKLIPSSHLLLKTFITEKIPDNLFGGGYDISSNVFSRYALCLLRTPTPYSFYAATR